MVLSIVYDYANGISTYCKYNNIKNSIRRENTMDSIIAEYNEFIDAIKNYELFGAFLEFFDVVHSIIKMLILNIVPENIYCNYVIWLFVFPFVFPVATKLAFRYRKYGCIRNHGNPDNVNHYCDYKY